MRVDVHFGLDPDDPQGQQALNVLAVWEQQGYAVDDIVMRALLALGERQQANQASTTAVHVKDVIQQMRDLLQEVQALKVIEPGAAPAETQSGDPNREAAELSQAFLNAVKKAARPGLRLDA
jgi:hypothetical protein